jgi:murein DD-endopeptidase MepM/ murein hydrolase activator NlpD
VGASKEQPRLRAPIKKEQPKSEVGEKKAADSTPTLTAIPSPVQDRTYGAVEALPKAEITDKGTLKIKPKFGKASELTDLKSSFAGKLKPANWDSTLEGVSRQFKGTPIPKPAGYGHYCSIVYNGGGWMFGATAGDSDPCTALRKDAPRGKIARAGLWSEAGGNNVMVRCDGAFYLYRANGAAPIDLAYDSVKGQKNCVFTVAPTELKVFGLPYGKTSNNQSNASSDVTTYRGYDYNVYNVAMSAADFGQTPASYNPSAIWIDRQGKQRDYQYVKDGVTKRADGEAAYDLVMPGGKPIVSVADGEVIMARWRDVTAYNCGADAQGEIYVYHQVGTGVYAERFISYYAHESVIDVKTGDKVTRGQVLGKAGNTGCSGGNHLHLSVLRTTNLSGARSYYVDFTSDGYGINGIHGIIDPFGWAAPQHIDPWAWMQLQSVDERNVVKEPGAFSIKLWDGAAPPSNWN